MVRGASLPMNTATKSDQLADTLVAALVCVECGAAEVAHVVALEGIRTVLIPLCVSCWERIGGESGYDAILNEAIRQRQVARNN
jgi:hypothetical protein